MLTIHDGLDRPDNTSSSTVYRIGPETKGMKEQFCVENSIHLYYICILSLSKIDDPPLSLSLTHVSVCIYVLVQLVLDIKEIEIDPPPRLHFFFQI